QWAPTRAAAAAQRSSVSARSTSTGAPHAPGTTSKAVAPWRSRAYGAKNHSNIGIRSPPLLLDRPCQRLDRRVVLLAHEVDELAPRGGGAAVQELRQHRPDGAPRELLLARGRRVHVRRALLALLQQALVRQARHHRHDGR